MIKVTQQAQRNGLLPDLTPLLDIIFIVMVFLMLTAAVKLDSLDVDLPTVDSPKTSNVHSNSLAINVLESSPHWAINGKQYIDWENFTLALLEEHRTQPQPIVVGAEKTADVQHLVRLLAFLRQNGIQDTQILTQDPK